jgi:hypothetical protein
VPVVDAGQKTEQGNGKPYQLEHPENIPVHWFMILLGRNLPVEYRQPVNLQQTSGSIPMPVLLL